MSTDLNPKPGFNKIQVFIAVFTALTGSLLFVRFGFVVGTLGFFSTLLIIITAHLVTLPAALATSEISSNQKLEGGNEYAIYSQTFGMPIGAILGTGIYIFQLLSLAFSILLFTETFEPFFRWANPGWQKFWNTEGELPVELISVPSLLLLYSYMNKGKIKIGIRVIFGIAILTALALLAILAGDTAYTPESGVGVFSLQKGNLNASFFSVFVIIFPVFAAMSQGFGFFGRAKRTSDSVAMGTIVAILISVAVYFLLAWKLTMSVNQDELMTDYYVLRKIMVAGPLLFPLVLAAGGFLAAANYLNSAPGIIHTMAVGNTIPLGFLNKRLTRISPKKGNTHAAKVLTLVLALLLVLNGKIDYLARLISIVFLVSYGFLCLVTFMIQFGANPAYRPAFKSRWYISFVGFIVSLWLLIQIHFSTLLLALLLIVIIYIVLGIRFKNSEGLGELYKGVLFQFNRRLQLYLQNSGKTNTKNKWRPSVICVSSNTFDTDNKTIPLLEYISYRYGFGTYIHLIEDYFSTESRKKAGELKEELIQFTGAKKNVYIDTLISPSYTSAVAQSLQLPGISGMPNNLILFDASKDQPTNWRQIAENMSLAAIANLDLMLLVWSKRPLNIQYGIHIWINNSSTNTSNLMLLLGSIIHSHPECNLGKITFLKLDTGAGVKETKQEIRDRISSENLLLSDENIEIVELTDNAGIKETINNRSSEAGLIMIGFEIEEVESNAAEVFSGFESLGNVLFVCSKNIRNTDS